MRHILSPFSMFSFFFSFFSFYLLLITTTMTNAHHHHHYHGTTHTRTNKHRLETQMHRLKSLFSFPTLHVILIDIYYQTTDNYECQPPQHPDDKWGQSLEPCSFLSTTISTHPTAPTTTAPDDDDVE